MSELTDLELIEKCLMGDQDYFAVLVNRYKKLVYSTVSYYIRDTEEVNDISQEVFLRIYKALNKYNPQFKFSTWSVRIARNLCLDYLRKKKIQVTSLEDYESACRDDDNPESISIRRESSEEIQCLINQLPEKYKSIIILYHEKGASYKEMAEILNKPMSIIKNRLYRARMALKESFLDLEGVY